MAAPLSHYAGEARRRFDLIERSLKHLQAGKLHDAFLFADISCLSRVPAPEDLLLRGEIAARLGFEDIAEADIREAFAIDPSLAAAQLRMLGVLARRGETDAMDGIARGFLRMHPQQKVLRAALASLRPRAGSDGIAWLEPGRDKLTIHVLASTLRTFRIDVRFEGHAERIFVQVGQKHALASVKGAAASFDISWPRGSLTAALHSEPPLDWTGPAAFRPLYPLRPKHRQEAQGGAIGPVTIVVPVYDGLESTKACLESVLASRAAVPQRIVVVDDCGPDPALRVLMREYAQQQDVVLIENPINLGFIGSVNRALMAFPDGDVVLLNSDTLVAPGWLDRLSRTAHARPKVGTVTPLSNNGELTSVPAPFQSTPMPEAAHVALLDALARDLNEEQALELPNGVGFCLYITESCRRHTGLLNDVDYEQGYLEEVDYCLRATELGFTHLCACDVFVGHAGSQSFQDRKRGLVKHNLSQLERAFPAIKAMTHRFVEKDPLRATRTALQRRLLRTGTVIDADVTLVIGQRSIAPAGEADLPSVKALAATGPLLRLGFSETRRGRQALLHRDAAMVPYRLPFDLSVDGGEAELLSGLRSHRIGRVVYLDAHHPDWVRALPGTLGVEYELHLTDDGILAMAGARGPGGFDEASFCNGATRFICPSRTLADRIAACGMPYPEVRAFSALPADREEAPVPEAGEHVAVFLDAFDIAAWRWLHALARRLASKGLPMRLVVFGPTIDDDALRRTGVAIVTGRPTEALARSIFALHRCAATLALISPGACDHASLGVISAAPKPILTLNPYLRDLVPCSGGGVLELRPEQSADDVIQIMSRLVEGRGD